MRLLNLNRAPFINLSIYPWILFVAICHAADPQPISVSFGDDFIGYDGKWSPAQIRVGTPEQWLLTFPGTVSSETWVVGPNGCDGSLTCQDLRGGLFDSDASATWTGLGNFELGFSTLSQSTDYGYYGFDNISVIDNIVAPNQVIAIVNDTSHWIGQFGLGVKETRFDTQINYLSFLSTMVQNESAIPSHSYGYTAGAYYKEKSTLGSLTLGGVDSTRFTPSGVSFTLAGGYVPMVAITGLEVSSSPASNSEGFPLNWNTNPRSLMPASEAALFTIDSSTPFLWLPENVCDSIAAALNLTYDDTIQLYKYSNSSTPTDLAAWGLQFVFTLANSATSTQTTKLTVSYDAFNQQLSYPFPGLYNSYNSTLVDYFPLRRAINTDQYTIGRVFLQETYLTVDYERNNFSLSPAVYPDTSAVPPNLVPITRPLDSTWPGATSTSTSGLSTGAKVGIGIGVAVAVIAAVSLLWVFLVKRRNNHRQLDEKDTGSRRKLFGRSKKNVSPSSSSSPAELVADRRQPTEMTADASNSRFELAGSAPIEMPAGDVSPAFFQEHSNNSLISRNDPRNPTEMDQPGGAIARRTSTSKEASNIPNERSETPAPAYTPPDGDDNSEERNNSHSISPYSVRPRHNPFASGTDTSSSGEQGISPVTGSGSDRDQRSNGNNSHTGSSNYSNMRPSPISPVTPDSRSMLPLPNVIRPGQQQSRSIISNAPSSDTNVSSISRTDHNNRLSPGPPNEEFPAVERSASRSSRFREVLNDDHEATEATSVVESARASRNSSQRHQQRSHRPPLERARFSWEES